jgi:hypothetical protein
VDGDLLVGQRSYLLRPKAEVGCFQRRKEWIRNHYERYCETFVSKEGGGSRRTFFVENLHQKFDDRVEIHAERCVYSVIPYEFTIEICNALQKREVGS